LRFALLLSISPISASTAATPPRERIRDTRAGTSLPLSRARSCISRPTHERAASSNGIARPSTV
jgi:hypothetical protein